MQYLTYAEFTNMGGTLEETAFNHYIYRAIAIIDSATKGRIKKMLNIPVQVKALCMNLIEYLANNSVTEKPITNKSQTAGNVSESVSYTVKTQEEQALDIDNMICDYLLHIHNDKGTPLLYRGCAN